VIPPFAYDQGGTLRCDGVDAGMLADRFGTPLYVYSADGIRRRARALARAFAPLRPELHFAVKACNTLAILRLIIAEGLGIDAVSGGELERARLAGCPMDRVSFAGVGKTRAEIDRALALGIAHFNVESGDELERTLHAAQAAGRTARYCLRINPNVDARTHRYTTTGKHENKFGVDPDTAVALLSRFTGARGLEFAGFHAHLGSPIHSTDPYREGIAALLDLTARVENLGHRIEVLDIGGGFGADYTTGQAPSPDDYAAAIIPMLAPLAHRAADPVRIILEPGRSIVAEAGLLLTRLHSIKHGRTRTFAVADAGMHTLIRPALYEAFHFAWPARVPPHLIPPRMAEALDLPGLQRYDLVGPICESGDFLALGRDLPPLARDDLIAVFTAGAYGMTMSSSYNDQPRPAEVLVDGDSATLIRRRQTIDDLTAQEDPA
jgi:diaminopimelate decarboxylase